MNELRLVDIAEHRFDFRRWPPHDASCFLSAVIYEPARDFASVGRVTPNDFAAPERAGDSDDADRKQALAVVQQRAHRACVERESTGDADVIGKPLLARAKR